MQKMENEVACLLIDYDAVAFAALEGNGRYYLDAESGEVRNGSEVACEILSGSERRYLDLLQIPLGQQKEWLYEFSFSIKNKRFARELRALIQDHAVFLKCEQWIQKNASEWKKWSEFFRKKRKWRVTQWLASHGLFPLETDSGRHDPNFCPDCEKRNEVTPTLYPVPE